MENELNKRIKIVLLTDCFSSVTAGGAERQIYELARRLNKSKHDVTIASLEMTAPSKRDTVDINGFKFILFPLRRIYGISGFVQGLNFFKFLKEEKADILMTFHFSSDMWGTILGKLAGVPVIISNRRDMGFWRSRRHIEAYKIINRWVDKIIVNAVATKTKFILEENLKADKVEVIYNGIDILSQTNPDDVIRLKKQFNIKEDEIVIVHVASLKPVKGHEYLLRAIAQISYTVTHVRLVLIGKDELSGQLQALAQELGIEKHVLFLGSRDDARNLIALADICVLPSLSEGMSNAILEYMASAKPVVTTNVGGNPELIEHGCQGLLCPKENVLELKNALEELIADGHRRLVMGQNGLQKVQKDFSMGKMVSTYESLFSRLLEPPMMKVLHLISSNGLYGAERVILNLASYNGFPVTVAALKNIHNPHLEIIAEANRMGIKTAIFESSGRFDIKTIFRVRDYLKKEQIDLIHTHNYKSDILGFFASFLTGKKWVATNHVWHGNDHKLKIYESIDAFILRFGTIIFAVSDEIREILIKKNINRNKVKVIHNGIDISAFNMPCDEEKLRQSLKIYNHEKVVSIVGRLSEEKGHQVFLNAAKEVLQKEKDVKFLIVGGGSLAEILKQQVQRMGLEKQVIFTGIRQDIPQIYAISDILVNASSIEGLPMTILEAMAAKVPIIATPVGAVPQVITNGQNGMLVAVGDEVALAQSIIELLRSSHKSQLLAQEAYRDVNEKFSVVTMARKYKTFYEEIFSPTANVPA